MKKSVLFSLTIIFVLLLCACGKKDNTVKTKQNQPNEVVNSEKQEEDSAQNQSNDVAAPSEVVAPQEPAGEPVQIPSQSQNVSAPSNPSPKDNFLAAASVMGDYVTEMRENETSAKEKYVGKIYRLTGYVLGIHEDRAEISDFTVYLSKEELSQLTLKQRVTVVGKIDSLAKRTPEQMDHTPDIPKTEFHGVMSTAFFVTDTSTISGKLHFGYLKFVYESGKIEHNFGKKEYWSIRLDDAEGNTFYIRDTIPVNHVIGQEITSITLCGRTMHFGDKITISGKAYWGYDIACIKEVNLVSVDN